MATQLRFDVTALDQASRTFARMAQAVERFEKRLDRLDGKKVDVEVGVDTKDAEREIGAFATNARRRIDQALSSIPDVEINGDSSDLDRELADVRSELASLRDTTVGVDLDADEFNRRVDAARERLQRLASESPSVQVRADAADELAKLALVNTEADRIDGRTATIKVKTDKSLSDSVVQIGALARSLGALALPAGLLAATPQLLSLGASAVEAAGALGLIPAAGTAGALAVGALVVGFKGFKDALGDNPKKAAEGLSGMAKSGQEAVSAIRGLAPAWQELRLDVQQRLFAGIGRSIADVGGQYLPVLRGGLAGVAAGFNESASSVAAFMSRASTVRDWQTILAGSSDAVRNLSRAFAPLMSVFTDLAAVGAPILRQLAQGAADATTRFAAFISRARETGQLGTWMQHGVDVLRQMGQVAVNVGSSLMSVFRAAQTGATPFLTTLEQATGRMRAFLASAEGQARMVDLFNGIRGSVATLAPLFSALATAAANVAPHLHQIGLAMLALRAGGSVVGVITLLAAAFPPLISAMSQLAPLIPVVVGALVGLRVASTLGGVFRELNGGMTAAAGGATTLTGSIRNAGSVMGGFRAAASGLMGMMGGPFGLALAAGGIALGLLAQEQQKAAQKAQEHKAALDSITGTLDSYTGMATQATNAEIAKQLASDGSIDKLRQLGVSTSSYTDAMAGNGNAIRTVTDQLHGQTRSAIQASDAYRDLKPLLDANGVSLETVALAAEGNVGAQQQVAAAVQASAAANSELGGGLAYTAQSLYEAGGASAQFQGRLNETASALEKQRTALQSAAAAASDFGRELETVKPGFEAMAQGASITPQLQQRFDSLAVAALKNADAVGKNALQYGNVATAGAAASSAMQQSRDQFIAAATGAGMTEQAAAQLADRLGLIPAKVRTDFENNAEQTALQLNQLNDQIRAVPPGKAITIDALTAPAEASLTGLGLKVERMKDGKIKVTAETREAQANLDLFVRGAAEKRARVTIDGQDQPAREALANVLGQIAQGKGMVNIDGNPQPAQQVLAYLLGSIGGATGEVQVGANRAPADQVLNAYLAAVRSGQAMVTINGNKVPADQVLAALTGQIRDPAVKPIDGDAGPFTGKLEASKGAAASTNAVVPIDGNPGLFRGQVLAGVGFANGSTGTMTIDGNPQVAFGKTRAAVSFADGSTGRITIDGNQTPANGKVQASVRYADGSRGTITVDARDLATPKINSIPKSGTTVWTIQYVTVGAAPGAMSGSAQARASGGYARPRAKGGYAQPVPYASGGWRPMSAARAEIVPARQPRLIGDRMLGDEAFIPVNRSLRSLSILARTNAAMGRANISQADLDALLKRTSAGALTGRINLGTDPAAMLSTVRAAQAASTSAMVAAGMRQAAAIAGLRGGLDRLDGRLRSVVSAVREAREIHQHFEGDDYAAAARETQLLMRL